MTCGNCNNIGPKRAKIPAVLNGLKIALGQTTHYFGSGRFRLLETAWPGELESVFPEPRTDPRKSR